MNGLSVIIPSKTASNLIPCVEAVRLHEPQVSVHVIDDGLDLSFLPRPDWDPPILGHRGEKPFIFARNVNLGIDKAGTADCVLLNDDALLQTAHGFTLMQLAAHDHPEYGIISAITNVAGNVDQWPQGRGGVGLRDAGKKCVAFVCVLIPRRTIDLVGLLDERFGGMTADGRTVYGWDDNDYCRRVRNAGLKVGIFDGCYVDHGSLRSTFRGDPRAAGDIWPAAEIYRQKWGDLA